MTKFPLLVCVALPPLSLLPMLLPPRLLTVMMKFPLQVSALVLCTGDAEVSLQHPSVSCLSSSLSPPSVRPQPALQAGGRG
jgi:hypothetical protein